MRFKQQFAVALSIAAFAVASAPAYATPVENVQVSGLEHARNSNQHSATVLIGNGESDSRVGIRSAANAAEGPALRLDVISSSPERESGPHRGVLITDSYSYDRGESGTDITISLRDLL